MSGTLISHYTLETAINIVADTPVVSCIGSVLFLDDD